MKEKQRTKYTYGQFASVCGKRYRVRKAKYAFNSCKNCTLRENEKCKLTSYTCVRMIPIDAYFEKV